MGRRRRDDDDDDDFDDRPSRRRSSKNEGGGGGKTVLIVVGIIAAVIIAIVAICGGLGYYVFYSAKKSVNNTFSSLEASFEGDSFLSKLSINTQSAYDSTSPGFKSSMSRDAFEQLLKRNPVLTKMNTRRTVTTNAPTGSAPNRKVVITYEVTKFGADDPEPFVEPGKIPPPRLPPSPRVVNVTLTLAEQSSGIWKVDGITVP